MVEEEIKPLEGLSEEEKSTLVTNSAKEVHTADLLVCGRCNAVCHFIEEFQEHKESNCTEIGNIKETLKDDKKPQIWAFTLWKNTQLKKGIPDEKGGRTSWSIYQTWRAMKAPEKATWMAVASNMQALYDIVLNLERAKLRLLIKKEPEEAKETKPPVILNKIMKSSNTRKAFRTGGDPENELLVEEIVSKRYNPRKKTFEYLIKWEDLDSEMNSWEATASLYNCKNMMDEFEKQLQNQREQNRAAKTLEKAKKAAERPTFSEGRPQRTSKQKALNQVKAWCGAENQEEDGGKRAFSDDSDDEYIDEKRIKMEADSDSEDSQPIVTIKRVTKNGVEKRVGSAQKVDTITLPDNILIPDDKGIVRISQKQIPSLSSGVYVMSKTAGIIKLDTAAASKLTQGGANTVLRVAPRGQTTYKVVKKSSSDMSNGATAGTKAVLKTVSTSGKPLVKNYSGKVYMQRRNNTQAAVTAQAKKNDDEFDIDMAKYDDESDGVEELEFPEEITLPTADSPPPEFSLCPLTGQVVDKNGAAVVTEAEDTDSALLNVASTNVDSNKIEAVSDILATSTSASTTASSSLGNLVNIAAAEILDDLTDNDLKSDDLSTSEDQFSLIHDTTNSEIKIPQSPPPLVPSTPTPNRVHLQHAIVGSSPATSSATKPSILSTALSNANIVRRGPPKLVRRTIAPSGIVHSRTPQQLVRHVGTAQTKQTNVVTRVLNTSGQQVRQIRPGAQVIRKRIIQVPAGHGQGQVRQIVQRSVVRQPTKVYQQIVKSTPQVTQVTYVATPTHSNKVISMPSLTESSVPTITTISTPPVQKEKVIAPKQHVQQIQQVQSIQQVTQPVVQQIIQPVVQEMPTTSTQPETTTFNLADAEAPLLITGEDGTIYQVAGQNEDGQTILIAQGEDGEQQCLLVAPENAGLITQALGKSIQPMSVQQDSNIEKPPQSEQDVQQSQVSVEEQLAINTAVESEEATDESQVVAQIVSANPPSPGGTRKVVLMLPDGNFMMTEVTAEQYTALELDK